MITLDRLRYFLTAAKLEHVGRAAKKLNTSPSVISSAIKELESTIGCDLFIREKNKIKLGLKGEELLERAQFILKEVDHIQTGLKANSAELRGHYKFGGSHFLMQEFLIPAALDIKKTNDHMTMEFVSLDSGVAITQVVSGVLDAALVFRSSYFERLSETVLYEDDFQIFVANGHPILKAHKSRTVDQLNALPAVTFRTATGANFWEHHPAFHELGILPLHSFFYDATSSCIQILEKTGGWAFLPRLIGKRCHKISELSLPKKIKAPVNISMVLSGNSNALPLIQKLNERIKKKLPS